MLISVLMWLWVITVVKGFAWNPEKCSMDKQLHITFVSWICSLLLLIHAMWYADHQRFQSLTLRLCDLPLVALHQIVHHMSVVNFDKKKWWELWEPVENPGSSSFAYLCYCVATQFKNYFSTNQFVLLLSFSVIWGLPHPMMQLKCCQKRGMWHPLKLLLSLLWYLGRRSCQQLCLWDVPKTCCYPGTGWELRKSFSNIKLYLWVWSFPFHLLQCCLSLD